MENEELREVKRETMREMDDMRREIKSFKRRVSTIANLFIPGIGFIIYGSKYLEGIIFLALFSLLNLLYYTNPIPDMWNFHSKTQYYIPLFIIWIVSTVMVSGLDD